MKTLRKYRVAVLAVAIIAAMVGAIWLVDSMMDAALRRKMPAELISTNEGVWCVTAYREPELLYTWEHDEHTVLRDARSWYIVDGDTAYEIDPDTGQRQLNATGLALDWSLGAAAVQVKDEKVCPNPEGVPPVVRTGGRQMTPLGLRWLELDESGALYVDGGNWRYRGLVDSAPGLTEEALAPAVIGKYVIVIPMPEGLRAYYHYNGKKGSIWQRWDVE